MKKLFLFFSLASLTFCINAQAKKKPVTAAKPAGATAVAMKNADDSVSYAIGVRVADFFKQQNNLRILVIDTNDVDFVNNESEYNSILDLINRDYAPGIHRVFSKVNA